MENCFRQDGYEITLCNSQEYILVNAKHLESLKAYFLIIKPDDISKSNMNFICGELQDMYDSLISGLKKIDNTKVYISDGLKLVLEVPVTHLGRTRNIKQEWILKPNDLDPLEECESIITEFSQQDLKTASPAEGKLFLVMLNFLKFGKLMKEKTSQNPQGGSNVEKLENRVNSLQGNPVMPSDSTSNIKDVIGQIDSITRRIAHIQEEVENTKNYFKWGDKKMPNLAVISEAFSEMDKRHKKEIKELQETITEMDQKYSEAPTEIENIQKRIEVIENRVPVIVQVDQKYSKVFTEIENIQKRIEVIENKVPVIPNFDKIVQEVNLIKANLSAQVNQKCSEVSTEIEDARKRIEVIENSVAELDQKYSKVPTEIEDARKRIEDIENKVAVIPNFEAKFQSIGEKVGQLEYLSKYFGSRQTVPVLAVAFPVKEMIQSDAYVQNGFEYELFRTSNQILIQIEDLSKGKIYYKEAKDENIKGLTLATYSNTASLFDGLVEALKNPGEGGTVTFAIAGEGWKLGYVKQKKFTFELKNVIELKAQESNERALKKLADCKIESQFFFERRLKQSFYLIRQQSHRASNMINETMMKLEQLEKSIDDLSDSS